MKVRFQLFGFPSWARDAGDPSATQGSGSHRSVPTNSRAGRHSWQGGVDIRDERLVLRDLERGEPERLWSAGPSPTSYANLLVCSYVTVKDLDPHATIVSGVFPPTTWGT